MKTFLDYVLSLGDRVPTYLFPVLLIFIEYILRISFPSVDTLRFIGPTFAAAGIGMILPITYYNNRIDTISHLAVEIKNVIINGNFVIDSKRAKTVRFSSRILIIFLLAAWVTCVYYSFNLTKNILLNVLQYGIGIVCYVIGVVATEVKEIVDESFK